MITTDLRYYVYEWFVVETNEIFYVGKGTKNRYKTRKRQNKFFMNFLNSHNCESRILFDGLSETDAYQKEIETISNYKRLGYRLTNQTIGGDNPPTFYGEDSPTKRPDVRLKISIAQRKYWSDKENVKKHSDTLKAFYKTEEGKRFARDRHLKKLEDPAFKELIASRMRETCQSDEYRKKKSEIMKKAYSNPEVRKKVQGSNNGMARKIEQLSVDDEILEKFDSLIDAQNKTGISFKSISKVLRGTNKTAGGYKWRYQER